MSRCAAAMQASADPADCCCARCGQLARKARSTSSQSETTRKRPAGPREHSTCSSLERSTPGLNPPSPGGGLASPWCWAPSAASACGRCRWCCRRCRPNSALPVRTLRCRSRRPCSASHAAASCSGACPTGSASRRRFCAARARSVSVTLRPALVPFALVHLVVGFGASGTFGPLIADTSRWFTRRRGIVVAIVSSGNYVGGAIWPPVLHHFIANDGWRATHVGVGIFCVLAMLPFLPVMWRAPPAEEPASAAAVAASAQRGLGLSPGALQVALCIAGLSCCVAMAMPQVHIVAYCGDLGYGVARGAEMLSLMLGFGIVSRIASGFIADRIGGVATLLLSSVLQGLALLLYLFFNGLVSLYVISALFGLFQGGLVPMYAIIVRDYFSPREVGVRLGLVLMATLFGMAIGGWMSGVIFDLTGSYRAAFANGLVWNLVNVSIALWLLLRPTRRIAHA